MTKQLPNTPVDEVLRDIINLAVGASEEPYEYLPKTEAEVYAFKPHIWVENAIRMAYLIGVDDALIRDRRTTPEKVANALLEVALQGNLSDEKTLKHGSDEAYDLGFAAGVESFHSFSDGTNPYEIDSQEHRDFERGWGDGYDEAIDNEMWRD